MATNKTIHSKLNFESSYDEIIPMMENELLVMEQEPEKHGDKIEKIKTELARLKENAKKASATKKE